MAIGIDHILIAVEDLEKAMEVYRRLGFEVLRESGPISTARRHH